MTKAQISTVVDEKLRRQLWVQLAKEDRSLRDWLETQIRDYLGQIRRTQKGNRQ